MKYSIKYLENITGIKAHTIRIWEKRYKLLRPKRTKTNIRYYDNDDLKKILNVTTLLTSGYKISKIAKLPESDLSLEIKKSLNDSEVETHQYDSYINELIISSMNFDRILFEKTFSTCILKFGFDKTVEKILYPVLNRTGVLWQTADVNPAQEHFVSNLIKQKLFSAIDGLPEPSKSNKKFVLFLPENEDHEIGLLYFNYLLIRAGINTVYLGSRMPVENIAQTIATVKSSHLALFFVTLAPRNQISKYLNNLSKLFAKQKIIVCGNPVLFDRKKFPPNVIYLENPQSVKSIID